MKQNYFTYVLAALLLCFVSPAFAQVAKIGETEYATLSAAITAAAKGQTIELIGDITENVAISKNLTIDGKGKNYTGTMTANANLTVTVKNTNFVNGGFAKTKSTNGTYTIVDCTFDGNGTYAYPLQFKGANTINVENCTVKNYLYSFLYVSHSATKVSVKNVTVEDCPNYAVYFASGVTNATIEGLSVKNANNGIQINNTANRKLTIKDCKMENVTTAINHSSGTNIIEVKAEGENDFGTAGLSQYVKIAGAAAQLNGKFYASFDDAYKAAVKGDVITLLETAVISKNFTNYTKQITVKANFGATAFRVQGDAMMVTFGGMTIESNDYCITVGSKDGTTGANVDINGGTYKGSCTAISITKGDVRINGGTFSVEPYEGSYDYTINCIDAAYKNKDARISIKGGKFYNFNPANNAAEGAGTNFVTGGYTTAKDAEGWYTTAAAVAEVAGVNYISLADAVAAAEDGATIKLIPTASYTNGAGVVINKNITIDFNDKTYTVNKAVGSKGTETLGFQILKGNNVTLKNGTLTSKAVTEGNQVKMLIQNYANLTLENMNLEDATDHILYVLSNNCGETQLIGNTNITTDAVAFDSYKDNYYTAPTVTVETTGKIEGKIEKNDGATIAIKSGIFTTPIEAAWCAAGYAPAENGDGTYGVAFNPAYGKVAKIGDAYFETFAAAVAAATADQTITLIADVVEPKTVVFGKALKIDGAGHTFKGAIEFNKSSASYTIKNVNFDGEGTRVYALKTTASTGTLTVENCTCTNYTYGFLYANKSTTNLKVKNVTVEGVNYGVHSAYGTNITLENYHAIDTDYAVCVQNYGIRKVTLNNCTFEGCENPLYIWERNQTNKITFTFKGVNDMGKADFCTSGMAVIKATAMIGTKVYETLQAAVDAAQANETVTLLADATGAGVVINKDVTIDFNGKTYTVNKAVGSKGTETLGFQILKNNSVTLKNGTLKSTAVVEGKEVKMLVQNYASLNLVDMDLVDETEHIQYVLSNNSGNTELSGNTNITTDAVAFDSYFSQSYTAPTVTVKTTGKIAGNIEKNDGATIAIESGTYTMDVTAWCAAGYMCEANADGTYGITRANIQVGDDKYFATMEEAIAAIGDGDVVITLLADATLSYGAREAYGTAGTTSVTINGNGHTLTLNQTNSDWSSFGLAAGKVAFNNMTIEKTGHGDTSGAWNKHAIIFSSPVEMTNVTVNNSVAVQAGATLNNVTINEANGYYGLWINGNGQAVTVNGGEINATNGGRGIKIADQYIDAPAQVVLNVDGTVFSTAKKAAVLVSSTAGANITANDVNIENVTEDPVNFVWVDEDWAQYFANVQVTGATVKQEGFENFKASIDGACYETLEAAIAAAQPNQTITLIADITGDVTINKSLTIDGNGKNYTGTMTGNDNLTITVKNVNFVNGGFAKTTKSSKGVYTFVGCNFDGQDSYYYPLKIKGAHTINVENCTVKNYMYSFLYVYSAAINVSVKNVTVEDCPNYAVYFASGVANATIEGLSVKNANNGILWNNTANRELTIKDCQMEDVTTAINHSGDGTSIITVNAVGSNNFGGAAISKYVQINGTVDGISNPVAKIGETEYNSLSEAFAAAQDGETVTLIEDIELTDEDVISAEGGLKTIYYIAGKNIIFDMNEKKISVAYNSGNYLIGVFCVADGAGLTVTGNGIIDIPQKDRQVAYMFIKRGTTGYLVIENGTFHAGNLEDSMIYTNGNNIVTVKGGTFTIDNIGERVNGCPWIFNAQGNNAKYINVTGGTYNWDIRKQNWAAEVKLAEGLTTIKSGENLWTVGTAVAEVNGNAYATLADAIEAAEEDETVTLLADATGAGVVINKDVTIDFNGKTYTVNKAVGSKGTETLGFQILKGNDVTLENGTLTSTAVEEGNEVKMLIQNYADLSLVDMNLVDATDHILYVLSNNCGDSYVGGNTNITTDAVAFDSYKSKYYDAPMVTVETAGKITGAIEKNDGATIAIMSGTFTAEILPEWCAEYYVPVQNEDGNWTVVNTYVEELTFVDGQFTKFENDIEKTVGTLTYERTLIYKNEEDPEWNAIYLPFEVPMSKLIDNYEVAYFNDVQSKDTNGDGTVDDLNMELIRITSDAVSLRANYPYLIRAKNEEAKNLKIVLHDAKLYKAEENKLSCSSVFMTFEITGNNCAMSRNELGESLIVNTKGGWSLLSQTGTLKPWRLYLKITTSSELPWIESGLFDLEQMEVTMTVRGDDGGANGIENSKFELNVADSKYYDLMGRVVEHPVKGRIYIVNGKKVVY